jgi:tetratricopeptide (TPR) repeat protein
MDESWHKYRLEGEQAAQDGNYARAEAMWAMAALIAQGFAARDPRFAFSLDNLGQVLARQGKLSLAEYILGRSWQTKTQLNVSQIEAARTLNIVSELYFYQKRFEEAEQLISRVLAVYQTIYGRDHSHTMEVARNLGLVQKAIGTSAPPKNLANVADISALPIEAAAISQLAQIPAHIATHTAAPAVPADPQTASHRELPAAGGQANPVTVSYTSVPAIPSPNPNPGKPPAMSRRAPSLIKKCELCGFEMDGEWCGRCTAASFKAISPENRLT